MTSQAHRAAEMAPLPAQGFVRKALPQEGIKHPRSKKGGEIRKLITMEDVPLTNSSPEAVAVQQQRGWVLCGGW